MKDSIEKTTLDTFNEAAFPPSPMFKRMKRISTFMNFENKDQLAEDLIVMCQLLVRDHPDKVNKLVNGITDVVDAAIKAKDNKANDLFNGIESAIWVNEDCHKPAGISMDPEQYVLTAWQSVKAYFPDGTCDTPYASTSTKVYFKTFVNCLKQCKDKLVNSEWAVETTGCNAWLKTVLKNSEKE